MAIQHSHLTTMEGLLSWTDEAPEKRNSGLPLGAKVLTPLLPSIRRAPSSQLED